MSKNTDNCPACGSCKENVLIESLNDMKKINDLYIQMLKHQEDQYGLFLQKSGAILQSLQTLIDFDTYEVKDEAETILRFIEKMAEGHHDHLKYQREVIMERLREKKVLS